MNALNLRPADDDRNDISASPITQRKDELPPLHDTNVPFAFSTFLKSASERLPTVSKATSNRAPTSTKSSLVESTTTSAPSARTICAFRELQTAVTWAPRALAI